MMLMVVEENKKVRVVCNGRHISINVVVINVLLIARTCVSSLFTFTTPASFVHGYMTTSQNVSLGAFHFVEEEKDKKKDCFIYTTALPMHAFSKRQWHKKGSISSRKCLSCIKKFLSDSGSLGTVLLRDHAMSNGLVDGNLHHVSGKIIKDCAMQCDLIDREVANKLYHDFLSIFKVSSMSVEDIVVFGLDTVSYQRFLRMTSIPPDDPIPSKCTYDFLTSIRTPQVLHKQFTQCPNTNRSHFWPIGTFHDSPSMMKWSPLKFYNWGDKI